MKSTSAKSEWLTGLPLLLTCAIGMSGNSVAQHVLGQFMLPLEQEFGWSRTQVTLGMSISMMLGFVLSSVVGRAVDKLNARVLALIGLVLSGMVLAAFSLMNGNLVLWTGLWLCYVLSGLMCSVVIWLSVIPAAFTTHRSFATAIVLCGGGLGTAVSPVYARWLIELYDWRTAYQILGVSWFGFALLLAVLFFHDRRDRKAAAEAETKAHGAPLRGLAPWKNLAKSPTFVKLAAVVFMVISAEFSYNIHLSPALIDKGFEPMAAAQLAGLFGVGAIAGKLGVGWFFDRLPVHQVAIGVMGILAAACMMLAPLGDQTFLAIAACLTLGLSSGAMLTMLACVSRTYFPGQFGLVFGALMSVMALGAASGPTVAGMIHDQIGSYGPIYWYGVAVAGISTLILRTLKPTVHLQTQTAPAA
jgi:predicted MFS family arabinose efflux permease